MLPLQSLHLSKSVKHRIVITFWGTSITQRLWQAHWFFLRAHCSSNCGRPIDNISVWWTGTEGQQLGIFSACLSRERCCLCGPSWAFRMVGIPIKELHLIPVDNQLVLSLISCTVVDRACPLLYIYGHHQQSGLTANVYRNTQSPMPKDSPCSFLSNFASCFKWLMADMSASLK